MKSFECSPLCEKVFTIRKINRFVKSQHLFKANLILQANTPSPDQYTNSWLCPVSLRVTTHRPVAFVLGRLKLQWGSTYVIICKYGGVCQQINRQWSLPIISTYRWISHLKYIRNFLEKKNITYLIIQSNTIWHLKNVKYQ